MKDEKNEVTIAVHAKLAVDRETAAGCLWLVETFLNDNCDYHIVTSRRPDGTEHYQLMCDIDIAKNAGEPATDCSAGYAASCC